MVFSKKRNIIILIILAITVLVVGYTISSIQNEKQTKEKAAEVAIQHIKKEEHVDVIVTEVEIMPALRGGLIEVTGHVKNDKERTFFVTINNNRDYLVMGWNLDDPK
ncbi:hypothetical protein CN288_19230 [Bacillus sp. AFS023182]|uniref:hypothetical protein n=1 Tax=Bacillus sp. AFS023182 TaxID=2033492 RepID=UPI000BF653C8|nr:hypothetical protein [Bacillus sp. AFS023182]PFD99890.1 hypothetical protein CN288_19230 [Bacillus sp. AFS023182]